MSDERENDELATLRERVDLLEARAKMLVDILVGRETLTEGHRKILDKLKSGRDRKSLPQVRLGAAEDKFTVEGVDIDCAARLHLCGARCCRLEAPLGEQDLREGTLEWETRRPYVIKRADDGYCSYLGDSGQCGCYEIRPTTCRKFDCRADDRIWEDFDNRIAVSETSIRHYEEPS